MSRGTSWYLTLVIIITLLAAAETSAGINDRLLAYYTFNGTVNDSSGNNKHGVLYNGAFYTSGKFDQAAGFDRDKKSYIALPLAQNFANRSISTWIYIPANPVQSIVFSFYKDSTHRFHLILETSSGSTAMCIQTPSGTPSDFTFPTNTFVLGAWNHFVLTDTGGSCKIYINNTSITTVTLDKALPDITGGRVFLGANANAATPSSYFFNGRIDEFRAYDHALSESEIQTLYNSAPSEQPVTVSLLSGTLNDSALNTTAPSVTIKPGEDIAGSVAIRVHNSAGTGTTVPAGWCATWAAEHANAYTTIDNDTNTGDVDYTVTVNVPGPDASVACYLIFAADTQPLAAHIFANSCSLGTPADTEWDNGNDIADLGESAYAFTNTNHWFEMPVGDGCTNARSPGVAMIRVVVQEEDNATTTSTSPAGTTTTVSPETTTSTEPATTTSMPLTTTTVAPLTTTSTTPVTTTIRDELSVDFMVTPSFGFTPLTVNFINASTGAITGYLWNFGDGSTSSEENPIHIYSKTGLYGVVLTAYGAQGTTGKAIKQNCILAIPNPPCAMTAALDNEDHLLILRLWRDAMLTNTVGITVTSLYYKNSPEIAALLKDNPDLQNKLKVIMSDNIKLVQRLVEEGHGAVSAEQISDILDFLNDLGSSGSPMLQSAFNFIIKGIEHEYLLNALGVYIEKN